MASRGKNEEKQNGPITALCALFDHNCGREHISSNHRNAFFLMIRHSTTTTIIIGSVFSDYTSIFIYLFIIMPKQHMLVMQTCNHTLHNYYTMITAKMLKTV